MKTVWKYGFWLFSLSVTSLISIILFTFLMLFHNFNYGEMICYPVVMSLVMFACWFRFLQVRYGGVK